MTSLPDARSKTKPRTLDRLARYGLLRMSLRLTLLIAILAVPELHSQTVDASKWTAGSVDLNDGWRTQEGDDAAWARTDFNDSDWKTVSLNDLGGAQPGWRWYRLHVKLPHGHMHEHLLIVGGAGVYAAYVNGEQVSDTGLQPWFGLKRPVEEIIPLQDDADDYVLALRTHAVRVYTQWHLPLFLTISVGSADAIDNERASFESQRLFSAVPSIAINLVLMLAGIAAFALFRSQQTHAEYMWLGLYLLLQGLGNGFLYSSSSGLLPLACDILSDPLIFVVTVMQIQFTFSFAEQRVNRIWRTYEAILLLVPVVATMVTLGWFSASSYVLIEASIILPAALLLPLCLLVWYRRGNREAGWLIVPSLLPAATAALFDLGSASIYTGWGKADFLANPIALGPVSLQISDVGDFLFVLAIGVVMFFRFTRVSREQMRGAAELEAAREIQRRLVPAQLPEVQGYRIEAAYFPAQEVGGDFYQILAQSNGEQLLVLGDVSGKGLKAAMTSTLAMGVLRTLAREELGPGAVLQRLNMEVAQTAEGGFITCVCVRLGRDGMVKLANAGHLAPYRNGEEVALEADLPLGIVTAQEYGEREFRLAEGERLTLLSDGVVEATDARGELLGFERTRALSGQPAAAIAAAALRFGQVDDITVVVVERTAIAEGQDRK